MAIGIASGGKAVRIDLVAAVFIGLLIVVALKWMREVSAQHIG